MIIAHRDHDKNKTQLLEDHLINVAEDAYNLGKEVNLSNSSFVIGILHDIGKADPLFQDMINNNTNAKVNHSSAGAKYLREYRNNLKNKDILKEEISDYKTYLDCLTYAILAHHGLFDILYQGKCLFDNRIVDRLVYDEKDLRYSYQGSIIPFLENIDNVLEEKYKKSLEDFIKDGYKEYKLLFDNFSDNPVEKRYYAHCFTRLLLSILKNSDIVDTINAYEPLIIKTPVSFKKSKIDNYYEKIVRLYESFGEPTTELNKARSNISKKINHRANSDSTGIYRLNLPTGAGKTNLTLLYAMTQMSKLDKKRMFYVAPFLSILEQNAKVIKDHLDDKTILEHHSNAISRKLEDKNLDFEEKEFEEDEKSEALKEYILESWDDTVVLTTMVQFFNTLFKDKSSNIRRFYNLNNSVIILDEVQSLPIEVTYNFNLMLNFISKAMNTTFILCTATQPIYDFDELNHKILYGGINNENAELIVLTHDEREVFKRTEVRLINYGKVTTIHEMTNMVLENSNKSVLIILNTKKAVLKTFENLKEEYGEKNLYYLTTYMCAQHRSDIISEIKTKLARGEKLICVSSQLIEAGVDLDFEFLIRSYAGIDSIIQAIGRCNREGLLDGKGRVYLINLSKDEENIDTLKAIRDKKYATEKVLDRKIEEIINNDGLVDIDLLNDEFYKAYYINNLEKMSYEIGDGLNLLDALSENNIQTPRKKFTKLNQAFKTAAHEFNLIKEETDSVIVYYKDSEKIINELIDLTEKYSKSYDDNLIFDIKDLIRKLQPYTIGLYLKNDSDLRELLLTGEGLEFFGVKILNQSNYNEKMGFVKEFEIMAF